jgi:hypothetical protein
MLEDRGHDCAEHGGVALQELESGLARLLGNAGGDHHRATASQLGVAPVRAVSGCAKGTA